jgi:hypothetical protein
MTDHSELKRRLRTKYLQNTVIAGIDSERLEAVAAIEELERSAVTVAKNIKRLENENKKLRDKITKYEKSKGK